MACKPRLRPLTQDIIASDERGFPNKGAKASVSSWTRIRELHDPFPNRIKPEQSQEPAGMVAKFHKVSHKQMMPGKEQKWKSKQIKRHRHHRFGHIEPPASRMFQRISPTEQGTFDQNASFPALGWNMFKN